MTESMGLPTLDFSHYQFGDENQRLSFARALVSSFARHGFVKLVNYGFSDAKVDELQRLNAAFFDLPPEKKEEIVNRPSPNPQRGWSFKGAETTAGLRKHKDAPAGVLTDEKEHFDMGPVDDTAFPNRWPEEHLPGFRAFLEPFYGECQNLCLKLMEACEVGLDLPPRALVDRCIPAASELRLNYYPEVTMGKIREGRTKRGWPHTDFGIITLLLQDQVGGLEYQDRSAGGTNSEKFLPLNRGPSSAELAINISDTFQRWTNDVIRAGVHQVTSHPSSGSADNHAVVPRRHSTVFFFKAHREMSVGPLPYFVGSSNPSKYDDITALQFHQRMTQVLIS